MTPVVLFVLQILGSLALFVFGMKIMSEGIQKFMGSALRTLVSGMTIGRFQGVLTGFATSSLIQSSSAVTVMIVSFVNAGLLNIRQAISVIMGANVGATVTAWFIVLVGYVISDQLSFGLPLMALGLPLLFSRKNRFNSLGEFFIGLAIIVFSIYFLKSLFLSTPEELIGSLDSWLAIVSESGFPGVVLFVFLGAALSVVAYSSAAVLVLGLVMIGMGLTFELAAAIVIGENLGTTITANLASLTGNIYAKRTAVSHFLFNAFGVIWVLLFFGVFVRFIAFATESVFGMGSPLETGNQDAARFGICMFHSIFNMVNTLLLFGFIDEMVKIVNRFIPSKGEDMVFSLEYIGNGPLNTPELSLLEAYKETARFGKITAKMNGMLAAYFDANEKAEQQHYIEKITRYEDITDRIEIEIGKYLTALSQDEISSRAGERVRELLSISAELERIGDIYYQIVKKQQSKSLERIYFTPEQRQGIKEMLAKLEEAFRVMQDNLNVSPEQVDLVSSEKIESEINTLRDNLRNRHMSDIEQKNYSVQSGVYYSDFFLSLEKIGDLVASVSRLAAGQFKA